MMTLLNGEPVDTGVITTGSTSAASAASAPSASDAPRASTSPRISSGPVVAPSPGAGIAGAQADLVGRILAFTALVLAIATPPMGIILGLVARAMLKPAKSAMATWAIVLGIIFTVLVTLAIIAWVVLMLVVTTGSLCLDGWDPGSLVGIPMCQ